MLANIRFTWRSGSGVREDFELESHVNWKEGGGWSLGEGEVVGYPIPSDPLSMFLVSVEVKAWGKWRKLPEGTKVVPLYA